jgi:hypothetical protein
VAGVSDERACKIDTVGVSKEEVRMSIISVQLKYLVRKTSARPSRNDWVPSDVRRLTVHNWGNFFLSQSPSYSIKVKDCSGGRFVIISDLFNKKRVFGAKWSLTSSGSLS